MIPISVNDTCSLSELNHIRGVYDLLNRSDCLLFGNSGIIGLTRVVDELIYL